MVIVMMLQSILGGHIVRTTDIQHKESIGLHQKNIPFVVPGELAAALVLSKCASARLDSVDASQALSLPGVEAFVSSVRSSSGYHGLLHIRSTHFFRFFKFFRF